MLWIWKDLRYAARSLRNQPGFTLFAVLALALGIGSATTIYSVIYNGILNPFPYIDAHRVVAIQIHDVNDSRPGGRTYMRLPEFLDYRDQANVFEEVIGGTYEDVLYNTPDGAEQFDGGAVTANMFQFLGVPALAGRVLTPEDAKPGAPPVFVMSYKMWSKRFNRDPKIVGRTFTLNNVPTTLIGIMPPRFTKLNADLYKLASLDRADPEGNRRFYNFQARLKPGIGIKQAEAQIDVIARRLSQVYPNDYPKKFTIQLQSWVDSLVGSFRTTLYILLAAVALLLLIACTNVANMLLARASAREKEIAIRAALGASRTRLVGQMLIESLLLAIGAAVVGCVFSYAGIKFVVAAIPEGVLPREAVIRLNVPVLLFSLGVAVLTAVLFGLVPAVQAARRDIVEPLKEASRGISGGFRSGKLRSTLVVFEVALSLVLLAGAGLLMRSFVRLQNVDLGFDTKNLLVARLPFPRGQYQTAAEKHRFFRALLPRLHRLPGVVAAAEITALPPYGGMRSEVDVPGKTHSDRWMTIVQMTSEGCFRTIGSRLLRGRILSESDVEGARKVAVVNQTFANKYFAGEDPLGRPVKIKFFEKLPDGSMPNPVFEVIGVTGDVKNNGVQDPVMPEVYLPYTLTGALDRAILVRTAGEPMALLNSVRREIWAVDRGVALTFAGSLDEYLTRFTYAQPRFSFILLGVFASVGLVLVALGVYSVMAYTVSRQTHEIGIRMALGAARPDVLRMVLWTGVRLIAVGAAIGLLGAFGVTRVIAHELRGVSSQDPFTFSVVLGVVLTAGLAACYFPARRATRVDPMIALRYE